MTARPAIKPAELRKMLAECAEMGVAVKVHPDGSVEFKPPKRSDDDDLSDVRMGK